MAMPTGDPADPLVLIVEDDLSTRLMYREYLAMSGFRIIDAHNGKQALEKVREQRPDAVVTDLAVPMQPTLTMSGTRPRLRRSPSLTSR